MRLDVIVRAYTKEKNFPVIEWFLMGANLNKLKTLFPDTSLFDNESIWIETQEQVDYLQNLSYFPYDSSSLKYKLLVYESN